MEKEFIPYEEALVLKELGFDEELCYARWTTYPDGSGYLDTSSKSSFQGKDDLNKQCLAPLYQQAFRWFREKHKLSPIISQFGYSIEDQFGQIIHTIPDDENPLCYEEAELACLKKLIEIVKNK